MSDDNTPTYELGDSDYETLDSERDAPTTDSGEVVTNDEISEVARR